MSGPTLKVTTDLTKDFKKLVSRFKNDNVLVGIPQSTATRKKEEEGGSIGNATLLALNHFGSPEQHIPPRPVLLIGIREAQEDIAEQFKKIATSAIAKGVSALDVGYERLGIIASNSVKKVINQQLDIEPPSETTLARRRAVGFKGTKSLIVTGQLRNAITYVVRSWHK